MSVFLATKLFNRTAHVISNPIDAFFSIQSRALSRILAHCDVTRR